MPITKTQYLAIVNRRKGFVELEKSSNGTLSLPVINQDSSYNEYIAEKYPIIIETDDYIIRKHLTKSNIESIEDEFIKVSFQELISTTMLDNNLFNYINTKDFYYDMQYYRILLQMQSIEHILSHYKNNKTSILRQFYVNLKYNDFDELQAFNLHNTEHKYFEDTDFLVQTINRTLQIHYLKFRLNEPSKKDIFDHFIELERQFLANK